MALDLITFYEESVLSRLTPDMVYGDGDWTEGRQYWTRVCPLPGHSGDRSKKSFSVHVGHLGYKCFSSCGTGSALQYVAGKKDLKGRDFVDAVERLASLAGVSLPERDFSPEQLEAIERREKRSGLLEAFLHFTQEQLQGSEGAKAREYLSGRGLGNVPDFFGYYPSREAVRKAMEDKGFSREDVEASGVVYDGRWEGRLIIPWRDRWGRLGTFSARDLSGEAEPAQKYLYMTTGNGWAKKKEELLAFGLDTARKGDKKASLVLVEGLLDVVLLHSLGFCNVAALGGTGTSQSLFEGLFSLGFPSLVLAFDNDQKEDGTKPGKVGTLQALENVRKVRNSGKVRNVPVYVLSPDLMGEYKDPDALVRAKGLEAFRGILERVESSFSYMAREILGDVSPSSPEKEKQDKAAAVAALADTVRGDRSSFDIEDLFRLVTERTGYSPEALMDELKRYENRRLQEERERDLKNALRDASSSLDGGRDLLEISRELKKKLDSVEVKAEDSPPLFSVDRLEEESKRTPKGRSSGWPSLDKAEVFFNPGELAIIGARTGHGKTSFMVNLLVNWLKKAEDEVFLFYSLEEPEVRIFHQLLSLFSEVWPSYLVRDYYRDGIHSRGEWPSLDVLREAQARLRNLEKKLLVVFRPSWPVDAIVSHARTWSEGKRVGGVFVDYLQRIQAPPGGRYDRRDNEVSAVARALKSLSVDLSAPVITGAQINRDSVPKDYGEKISKCPSLGEAEKHIKAARPILSNIREGGAEQEGDLVLGLLNYAADFTMDDTTGSRTLEGETLLEVGVLKNRYGASGRWGRLGFHGKLKLIKEESGLF